MHTHTTDTSSTTRDSIHAELQLTRAITPRKPFAWIESGPFLATALTVAVAILWAASQGWLA